MNHKVSSVTSLGKKNNISYFLPISLAALILFSTYMTSIPESHADTGTVNSPIQSFSNFTCNKGVGTVILSGQYTNGGTPYMVIFLKMLVLDGGGRTVATGNGNISDISAYEVKPFNAITRYNGEFSSCTVQIDSAIPK